MLQKLSYFNLMMTISYALIYLKSGTFNSVAGTLMIIVFSWLCLRSYQTDNYKWKPWHYLTGLWSLYYVGTLLYGVFNVLSAVIESAFVSNDTLTFLTLSTILCIAVGVHFILYFLRNLKSSSDDDFRKN